MFSIVALIVIGLVVALLIFAATRPDTFVVNRAANIKAPPEKIFQLVNDLHAWSNWSPWEKKDPAMRKTHSGAASGTGAVFEWEGNKDVGKGRMEITDASPPTKVIIKLDFIKPFEAHNMVEFTLAPSDNSTEVTWGMRGPMPFISKLMSVFVSMDSMVGKDFEAGLANLKALAEQ